MQNLLFPLRVSLTNSIPVLEFSHRLETHFLVGDPYFVLRFYAFHVFFLPIFLLGLMVVHFPRFLVFDVPMVMAISGAIMLTGGVFPVDFLGIKFESSVASRNYRT